MHLPSITEIFWLHDIWKEGEHVFGQQACCHSPLLIPLSMVRKVRKSFGYCPIDGGQDLEPKDCTYHLKPRSFGYTIYRKKGSTFLDSRPAAILSSFFLSHVLRIPSCPLLKEGAIVLSKREQRIENPSSSTSRLGKNLVVELLVDKGWREHLDSSK